MPYRVPINVRNYNDKGCAFRDIQSGYCVNTGKVMQIDKAVSVTTCPNCYYKDDRLITPV